MLVDVVAFKDAIESTNFSISDIDSTLSFTSIQDCPAIL